MTTHTITPQEMNTIEENNYKAIIAYSRNKTPIQYKGTSSYAWTTFTPSKSYPDPASIAAIGYELRIKPDEFKDEPTKFEDLDFTKPIWVRTYSTISRLVVASDGSGDGHKGELTLANPGSSSGYTRLTLAQLAADKYYYSHNNRWSASVDDLEKLGWNPFMKKVKV